MAIAKKTGTAAPQKNFADYAEGKKWGEGGGDFENLPDGSYVGDIVKAEIKQSKKGFFMLSVHVKVTEAEDDNLVNRFHFITLMFEGANGWNPWKVKEFFEQMGLELPEMADTEGVLAELIAAKPSIAFDLKAKGDFTNTEITAVEYPEAAVEEKPKKADKPSKPSREATKSTERDPEPPAEESAPTAEDVEGWDKDTCVAFAAKNNITLGSKVLSKIKSTIADWIADQESKVEDEAAEDAGEDDSKEKLIEFGASSGVELDDDMTVEEMKEELRSYEFPEEQLTAEDIAFLTEQGLESTIKRAAKKVAAKKGK